MTVELRLNMKEWFVKRSLQSWIANSSFYYLRALLFLICCCVCQVAVYGQQSKKKTNQSSTEDATRANEQEVIARLFGGVNDLKNEPDKASAALLLSEIADVLWRVDEPAARSMFRLAFDTARQSTTNNLSALNADEKEEMIRQARRRAAAIKTILKRYGPHDRRSAEAWLQEFQEDIKSEQTKANNKFEMSPEQAEFLVEMAVSLVPQKPEEAQRLGLLSLSAEKIPSAYGRLLMALRDRNKTLSDVLFRQAFVSLRRIGFNYDSALVSLTNYAFSPQGHPFPDVSPADVALVIQYFIDAGDAQAARWRGGGAGKSDEQALVASLYSFLNYRALPIVTLNAPDRLTLLQSHVGELARALSVDQRRQAEAFAAMAQQSHSFDGDSDLESRIQRAGREKNAATRDFLFRNLAIQMMRIDPEEAMSIASKIDDQQMRAQTEDEVLLVLLQKAFTGRAYDEAMNWALKFNDRNSQARWLTRVASRVASSSRDQTRASDLLSRAYSIAMKSDNTAATLEVLLLIAKEFVGFERDRGFEILSDALSTANKIEKTAPKTNKSSMPLMRVISVTMVDGQEVVGNEPATIESINFDQIGAFVDRDFVRTSLLGDNLKDRLLRTKYVIAIARSVLRVPRQGSGYERSIEDILSN